MKKARTPTELPGRILIYRIGSIGDTIISIPAIWDIQNKYPNAYKGLFYNFSDNMKTADAKSILEPIGFLNEYISYRISTGFLKSIINSIYNIWLILHLRSHRFKSLAYLAPSIRSYNQRRRDKLFFILSGITYFWGMDSRSNQKMNKIGLHESQALRNAIGLSSGPPCLNVNINTNEIIFAKKFLKQSNPNEFKIIIAPGAGNQTNKWPTEFFIELINLLKNQVNAIFYIVGSKNDAIIANEIVKLSNTKIVDLSGKFTPRQTIAFMELTDLFIGNDSGPLHMASCAKLPTIGIYGGRDYPWKWTPMNDVSFIHRFKVPCEYCGLSRCPFKNIPCLTNITPVLVAESVISFISKEKIYPK